MFIYNYIILIMYAFTPCPVLLQTNAKTFAEHKLRLNQLLPCKPLTITDAKTLKEHLYRLSHHRKEYVIQEEETLLDMICNKIYSLFY